MPTGALSILLASTTASLSLDLFVHPLDTIKTRIQSREYTQFLRANTGTSVWRHTGIFRGLYQGIGGVITASFPAAGTFFITYEYTQSRLQTIHQKLGFHDSNSAQVFSDICAASAADLVACVVYAPADALKHSAQMIQYPQTSGPVAGKRLGYIAEKATRLALKKFIHPRQLWSGYPALVMHSLPVSAIQMPLYEAFRQRITDYTSKDRDGESKALRDYEVKQVDLTLREAGTVAAMSAAVAGGIASILTAPMDIVRTRIMLDAPNTNAPQKRRIANAIRDILQTDGPKGLFRGCAINSVIMAVGSGLYFGLYEGTKRWLNSDSTEEKSMLV